MSDFSQIKALIIDDDKISIDVLRRLLEQLSIACYTIQDNNQIQSNLEAIPLPDIIFLDLEMPKQDGYDILEMFKSSAEFNTIPVVAYTTHTSHLNDARLAGFHSFLGKPLNKREFPEQVERILSGEHVWEVS